MVEKYEYKVGEDREQFQLIQASFDELIPLDEIERAIDKIIDSMNVHLLSFKYSEVQKFWVTSIQSI